MRSYTLQLKIAVAGLLLLASAAGAQDLDSATRSIGRAFRAQQATPLRVVLHDGVKTYVSLPSFYPEQGHFGASQVYYIFTEIFSRVRTLSFELSVRGNQESGPIYLSAVWHHKPRQQAGRARVSSEDNGSPKKTVLFMTLESDAGGYALTDIRESSP